MPGLWEWIREDWPRMLVSVFFASLIWSTVYVQLQDQDILREVPVRLDLPPSLALVEGQQLPRVSLNLRGSPRVLRELGPMDVPIVVAVPEDTPLGALPVKLRPEHVELPAGVHVMQMRPDSFTVKIDRSISERKVVRARFVGQPPPGTRRKNLSIQPERVLVTGPAKSINDISEVVTEAIELDPAMPLEFAKDVNLVPIGNVTVEPDSVSVSVEFARARVETTFEGLPLHVLRRPNSQFVLEAFTPPEVFVLVDGPPRVIDDLKAESLRPFIDLTDIEKEGIYRRSVHLYLNAVDCRLKTIQPEGYEFKVVRRPQPAKPETPE